MGICACICYKREVRNEIKHYNTEILKEMADLMVYVEDC